MKSESLEKCQEANNSKGLGVTKKLNYSGHRGELEKRIAKLIKIQKQLEVELAKDKQSNERIQDQFSILQGIIENSGSSIFSLDTNYCYTSYNRSHAAVMKAIYSADIELGKSILEYQTVAEDRIKAKANLDRALKGEFLVAEAYSGEESKSRLYFEITHSPIRDADGKVVGVAVYSRDLTGRKCIEETGNESEQRYQALFNAMTEGFALHEIICDEKGEPCDYRFLDINSAFERLTGLKREEIIGKRLSEVLPNEDPYWIKMYGEVALSGKPTQFENYSPAFDRYYQGFAYCPGPHQFAVLFMEITDRKRMEEALRQSEEKYRTLFETMSQGVVYWNNEGRIITANLAAERIMGLTLDQMQAVISKDSQWRTIHEDGTDFPCEDYPSIVALRTGQSSERTIMGFYNSRTATRRWISVNAIPLFRPGESQPYQVYATYEDITDLKQAEETLRNLSLSDELTGLYNRRGFLTLADQQLKLAHRMQRGLLLIFADLDGMKKINDTLGHQVGDLALIETANLIREAFRESDITARLSGDEFVILALDVPKGSAYNIVARMLENLNNHNSKGDRPYHLSISLGMAYYNPENPRTISELLTEADALMYQQKRNKNYL